MIHFSDQHRQAAEYMLDEMATMKLRVCKRQTDTGYVRDVVSHNPWWYSEICELNLKLRNNRALKKTRTTIKRFFVVETLQKIVAGLNPTGNYAHHVSTAIVRYIERHGSFDISRLTWGASDRDF